MSHKCFVKAFYFKTNKKESNLQRQQYNIYNTNVIAMRDMIVVAEKRAKTKVVEEKSK